jgi:hypothetical protein
MTISPFLKKKMQGKSCFNFTTINDDEIDELGSLTKAGIDGFKNIKLPWSD